MKFLKIVEEIQNKKENIDYLILVHCGVFFYAIGKDAVFLTEHFGLNNICITKNVCKCAISVVKIDKFIHKLICKNISVAIYDYYPQKQGRKKQYELLKRLLVHEYGHTLQSLILGPLYLIVIGIPSTLWGFLPNLHKKRKDEQISYFSFFTEGWANRLGEKVTGEKSMGNLVID